MFLRIPNLRASAPAVRESSPVRIAIRPTPVLRICSASGARTGAVLVRLPDSTPIALPSSAATTAVFTEFPESGSRGG